MKRCRRAFTLVELIAVIVLLGILSLVALPRYFDWSDEARESADRGALGGIRTALNAAYVKHRVELAPPTDWVTSANDVAATLVSDELPAGITIDAGELVDQRGNRYAIDPETSAKPATLTLQAGGGGGS